MGLRALVVLLWLSFSLSANPAPISRLQGQVERLERTTGRLQIRMLPGTNHLVAGQYRLYHSNGTNLADFTLLYHQQVGSSLVFTGTAHQVKGRITAGMQLILELADVPVSLLPDKFKEEASPPAVVQYDDGSEGVLIPQGKLLYGTQMVGTLHYTSPRQMERTEYQKMTGRQGVHYLDLPAFYMDRYEITRGQFLRFLSATGAALPPTWQNEQQPELPADQVSYRQAEAYCRWAGRRLPTELEWEKAARGSGLAGFINEKEEFVFREVPQTYPIGALFDGQKCITEESGGILLPARAMSDESPYGIFGLCGNVPEWTSSWLMPYRGNTLNHPWFGRKYKVIRGGGARLPKKFARSYERLAGGIPTLEEDFRAGFRCARSIN